MYDLDLVMINHELVKSLQLCGAVRRLIGKGGDGYSEIQDMEWGIRDAACECQRVLELKKRSAERNLLR